MIIFHTIIAMSFVIYRGNGAEADFKDSAFNVMI